MKRSYSPFRVSPVAYHIANATPSRRRLLRPIPIFFGIVAVVLLSMTVRVLWALL